MKNSKTMISVAIVAAGIALSSFLASPEENDYIFDQVVFSDLQEIYGDRIVDQNGEPISLDADANISFATTNEVATAEAQQPCELRRPCKSFEAYIENVLVRQANDCCCSFKYGVECCTEDGGAIAILYLISPTDPECQL